jgi:hypothetical protein
LPNVQRQKQIANLQPSGKFLSRRQILLKMMDNRASTQPMAANFKCYAFLSFAEHRDHQEAHFMGGRYSIRCMVWLSDVFICNS